VVDAAIVRADNALVFVEVDLSLLELTNSVVALVVDGHVLDEGWVLTKLVEAWVNKASLVAM